MAVFNNGWLLSSSGEWEVNSRKWVESVVCSFAALRYPTWISHRSGLQQWERTVGSEKRLNLGFGALLGIDLGLGVVLGIDLGLGLVWEIDSVKLLPTTPVAHSSLPTPHCSERSQPLLNQARLTVKNYIAVNIFLGLRVSAFCNLAMYQNLVEFYPPTRPIASGSKALLTSHINLAGVRGTCFYASR